MALFRVLKCLLVLLADHFPSFQLVLLILLMAFQMSFISACSLDILKTQKPISSETANAIEGSARTLIPSKTSMGTERPSSTPTPSQTASPTFTLHPTFTATITPTPSPTTPSATPRYRADINLSKFVADAGNFSLQAGETVAIFWENAPPGANRFEFIFIHENDESEELIGVDYDNSQGVCVYWWVPAHLVGRIEVTAYFSDGHIISDLWGGTIYSGSYPPQGICSMSSASVGVVQVFSSPSRDQAEIGYLEPGSYAQIFERYASGWYLISTSEIFFSPHPTQRPERAWVNEHESFSLHGPCDELPLK
jgi:hypothetical protein